MDEATISTFNTVCTAGHACEGFNGQTNEELKQLADVGLLVIAYAPKFLSQRPIYKPTNEGWELFERLIGTRKLRAESASGS
jgi:hypothetical protein